MARKAVLEGGKRDEIIAAALELFLEKGYEGTSIRMIQKKVKSEVGLFYYYFKNKDEVFERAMVLFFQDYKIQLQKIVEQGYRYPSRALTFFFEYMEAETEKFREKYSDKVHWTVRLSIREYSLTIIEPYLKEILQMLVSQGARPRLDLDITVMFLVHGVGSIILHEDKETYQVKRKEIVKGVNLLMGLDPEISELLFPYQAPPKNIPGWMHLLDKADPCLPKSEQEK